MNVVTNTQKTTQVAIEVPVNEVSTLILSVSDGTIRKELREKFPKDLRNRKAAVSNIKTELVQPVADGGDPTIKVTMDVTIADDED